MMTDTTENQVADEGLSEFDLDSNGYITKPVYLVVDESGEAESGMSEDDAGSRYDDAVGGYGNRRLVCIHVRVRVPRPVVVGVSVPDEAGQTVEVKPE